MKVMPCVLNTLASIHRRRCRPHMLEVLLKHGRWEWALSVCASLCVSTGQPARNLRSLQTAQVGIPGALLFKITCVFRHITVDDKPRDALSLSGVSYILLCFLLFLSPSYSHGSHLPDRKMKQNCRGVANCKVVKCACQTAGGMGVGRGDMEEKTESYLFSESLSGNFTVYINSS